MYGTACRWAGGSGNSAGRMLWACGDAVGAVPTARWVLEEQVDTNLLSEVQRKGCSHGAFVAGAQSFDAAFFRVPPAEAQAMDPQQRLLLELGYEALHGAGRRRTELMGSGEAVFVGIEMPDWFFVKASLPEAVRTSFAIGDPVCVASGRISFVLGLHGECKTIDTACASSLCAVHCAKLAVEHDDCSSALAAGVSLKLRPHTTLGLLVAGTVSQDGRCKTFDVRATHYPGPSSLCMLPSAMCLT